MHLFPGQAKKNMVDSDEDDHPVWQQTDFNNILENNKKWVEQQVGVDPLYFDKLSQGQAPKYLYIGCADSRVPVNEIMGLDAGDIFVHRNVANLCVNGDMNLLAVLQYSVEFLKIPEIIVCGHYGCGGVKAASSTSADLGLIEHWLRHIRDVQRHHHNDLQVIGDEEARHRRLVELNVQEQCFNLACHPIVQKSQRAYGFPKIHGFVYDLNTGLLHDLKIKLEDNVSRYHGVYAVHSIVEKPKEEDVQEEAEEDVKEVPVRTVEYMRPAAPDTCFDIWIIALLCAVLLGLVLTTKFAPKEDILPNSAEMLAMNEKLEVLMAKFENMSCNANP